MAGDGKLGGLVDPNDGQCHLNTSGFYDWSTVQGELQCNVQSGEQYRVSCNVMFRVEHSIQCQSYQYVISKEGGILFFQEGQHQDGY